MKGIYVLIIQLNKNINLTIGKLGKISFPKGLYAYVGSAQTNLEKRIARHYRKEKQTFWHIDYLLQNPNTKIVKTFFKTSQKTEECAIANKIADKSKIIVNFGCSDCKCNTHLFQVNDYDFLREFMKEYTLPKVSIVS